VTGSLRLCESSLPDTALDRGGQSLIGALTNGDAEVRRLAALRLGDYDLAAIHGDSIPALAEALRNETEPKAAATMAAVLGGSVIPGSPCVGADVP